MYIWIDEKNSPFIENTNEVKIERHVQLKKITDEFT